MKLSEHFLLHEFACKDGSPTPEAVIPCLIELAQQLEPLRAHLGGRPVTITSGYRSPEYNRRVGGAPRSQHVNGRAADIRVSGVEPPAVAAAIEELIRAGKMKQGGLGLYKAWVHYDTRGIRVRWGFP